MKNEPIKPKVSASLQNLRSSSGLVRLKYNNSFCNKIFEKNKIASVIDGPVYFGDSKNLVYDTSKAEGLNSELFGTIIDLLLQLRAAQDDQNIIVQNNTVLREQILNQLKNEIFRISHKLTKKQIKELEVVSSNSFDPKTLTNILNSFLENSKKKSQENPSLADSIFLKHRIFNINLEKTFANYRKIISEVSLHENIHNSLVLKKNFHKDLLPSKIPKGIKNEEKSLFENYSEEIYNEILEDPSIRKLIKKDKKFLKTINHIYENSIVNKSGIILPIIKIHSRISEIKILSKTKSLIERVLNKKVYKSLPSETELINKIVVKTQINELRENVTQYQEHYLNEQARSKREIKNLYGEVKKLHSSKTISQTFTDLFRNNKSIGLNVENLVKKNLNKLVLQSGRVLKFNNIYENSIQSSFLNKSISKNKIVNKTLFYRTSKDEAHAVYDKVDLTKNIIEINKNLLSKIQRKNITAEEIRNKLKGSRFLVGAKGKDRLNFKAISENIFKDFSYDEETSLYKIINKNLFYHRKENENKEIKQRTNVNRHVINVDNKLIKDIHENNVFIKELKNKYTNYKALLNRNDEINKESFQRHSLQKIYVNLNSQNVREYLNLDTKDHVYAYKKLYSEVTKNLTSKKSFKVYDTVKFNKVKSGIKEKINYDFVNHNDNLIINKFNKELVKKLKERITYTTVDRFKYLEHIDENLNKLNVFQRFINHDGQKVLNQFQLFKSLKDIHYTQQRKMTLNNQKKFIEDLRVFYAPEKLDITKLINRENFRMTKVFRIDKPKEIYVDKSHIVYKENIKAAKEEIKEPVKEEPLSIKEEPDVIIKEKPKSLVPNTLDAKAMEKRVMANTLGKKEIENLIKSYIGDIDIESISQVVINKIERKFSIDKRRSGIF